MTNLLLVLIAVLLLFGIRWCRRRLGEHQTDREWMRHVREL
jgi:uncharacterized membrane protein